MKPKVTTMLMAGGVGSRLGVLNGDSAKPAVQFGGMYRIIDFTLSNCVNSGLRNIHVLTQFKSLSLDRHINRVWRPLANEHLGETIETLPPQQRIGAHWYRGNADAIYQNIFTIENERPDVVVVLAGDHIYKMDYQKMIQQHLDSDACLTIAALPVATEKAAGQYGVLQLNDAGWVSGFEEKPAVPKHLPDDPNCCFASMGIYVFKADVLMDALCKNALHEETRHDFGHDVIPFCINHCRVGAFPFLDEQGQPAYWRDVGTLESYYDASMDLLRERPQLDLFDNDWPIWNQFAGMPPCRLNLSIENDPKQVSLIGGGTTIQGEVSKSVIGAGCNIGRGAVVKNSVLMDGVTVRPGATILNAIVTGGATIDPKHHQRNGAAPNESCVKV